MPDPAYLALAIAIVRRAGEIQIARRVSGFRVDKKGAIDLVTEVDVECERMCLAMVTERFPDHDLLGEEFPLAGAYIKKAVLRAAFYARGDTGVIGLKHLVDAARSESEELGTLVYDHISGALEEALQIEDEAVNS